MRVLGRRVTFLGFSWSTSPVYHQRSSVGSTKVGSPVGSGPRSVHSFLQKLLGQGSVNSVQVRKSETRFRGVWYIVPVR